MREGHEGHIGYAAQMGLLDLAGHIKERYYE